MKRSNLFLSALACMALLAAAYPVEAQVASATATIRGELTGLRNNNGKAGCSLYRSADGFPTQPEKAFRRMFVPIANGTAVCEFSNVPPGVYAMGAMHDENNDGKMNKNLFGAPTEGHGASNDSRGGPFGSPKFDEAKFSVATGTTTVRIPIHY